MSSASISLLTIITESAIESQIVSDLDQLGAPGYTICNARGRGHRGRRRASWSADSNIRIEVVCATEMAQELLKFMEQKYYDNFAMIAFFAPVNVIREQKFIAP